MGRRKGVAQPRTLPTSQEVAVYAALNDFRSGHNYGEAVAHTTGITPQTVSGILRRLEGRGVLKSQEEILEWGTPGTPRKFYTITAPLPGLDHLLKIIKDGGLK